MNVERMEKLAKYIETRPADNFDMDDWISTWFGKKEELCEADIVGCGTTCCSKNTADDRRRKVK